MKLINTNYYQVDRDKVDWIKTNDQQKYTVGYINHLIKKRYESLVNWFLYYITLYPNSLLGRIDLCYNIDIRCLLTPERIEKDIKRFIENQRHNQLFIGLISTCYIIEQGKVGSNHYHIHVLMLWDSKIIKSNNLNSHLDKICNYWNESITKGEGYSNNCNRNSKAYKYNCLGECNEEKISNCIKYLLKYLSKDWRPIYKRNGNKLLTLRKGLMGSLRDTIVNRYSNLNLKLKYNLL